MSIEKLSVSLPRDQVKWIRKKARSTRTTFSGLLSRLIEEQRQHEQAVAAFEKYFGDVGRPTPDSVAEIQKEWRQV